MNKYLRVALSLTVVATAYYFFTTHNRHEVAPPQEVSAGSPQAAAPAPVKITPPAGRAQIQAKAAAPAAVVEPVPAPSQTIEISLSETVVALLEREWNDLPLQAEASRELRGWRIQGVQPDSVFFRAGLRAGDLITTEFLNGIRDAEAGGAELALRVEQILNRISR